MTCIYTALCKNIMSYIHIVYRVIKYGIITLSYKMYAYCMFFSRQNAFPPYPIVIDTLMNFQYEGQLSFV